MRTPVVIVAVVCCAVAVVSAGLRGDTPRPAAVRVSGSADSPVTIGERYAFGNKEENLAFLGGYFHFEVLEVRGQWAFVQVWEKATESAGRKHWVNLAQARVIVPQGPPKKGE